MSLYGMMRTGVSGMNGQANRLSTVADNIANSDTAGYKRSKTDFATLVIPNAPGSYNSGGVTTQVRYQIADQGVLQYTTSGSDLAISGKGFFLVEDAGGTPYLTRAGSFVPDGQGRFVNAAGYYLAGYPAGSTGGAAGSLAGLQVVTVDADALATTPTTTGTFAANLPAGASAVAAADLPSTNAAGASYTAKSSLVAYDNLGNAVMLDVYFTKTGANTWEAAVYNQADATSGGFPYASGALATQTLTFDGTTGALSGTSSISVAIPGGAAVAIDMSGMTQLAAGYSVSTATLDGNGPSAIEKVEFSSDGTMYATYADGSLRALYRIPLADVPSPDMLSVLPGNVYAQSSSSGDIRVGFPGEGNFGSLISGAVEGSNVDLGSELTDMISAQRSYTANSKVFQTGADLLDILVNLKR